MTSKEVNEDLSRVVFRTLATDLKCTIRDIIQALHKLVKEHQVAVRENGMSSYIKARFGITDPTTIQLYHNKLTKVADLLSSTASDPWDYNDNQRLVRELYELQYATTPQLPLRESLKGVAQRLDRPLPHVQIQFFKMHSSYLEATKNRQLSAFIQLYFGEEEHAPETQESLRCLQEISPISPLEEASSASDREPHPSSLDLLDLSSKGASGVTEQQFLATSGDESDWSKLYSILFLE